MYNDLEPAPDLHGLEYASRGVRGVGIRKCREQGREQRPFGELAFPYFGASAVIS